VLQDIEGCDMDLFLQLIENPQNILRKKSIIHHVYFPHLALYAFKKNLINLLMFGTLMTLWGSLKDFDEQNFKPRFIKLFDYNETINPEAYKLLFVELEYPSTLPFLMSKSKDKIANDFFEQCRELPPIERGFWIVMNHSQSRHSIKRFIRKNLQIHFLDFPADRVLAMIPSFSMYQVFLDVSFCNPVRLNPVLGISSVDDIRLGSLLCHRDIALPFPGLSLPKLADGFLVENVQDFMWHDFYHALRASNISKTETHKIIKLGDQLHERQLEIHELIKKIETKYQNHLIILKAYFKRLQKYGYEQLELTGLLNYLYQKVRFEYTTIMFLKKIALIFGRAKFILYDMERAANGIINMPNQKKQIFSFLLNLKVDMFIIYDKLKHTSIYHLEFRFLEKYLALKAIEILKLNHDDIIQFENELKAREIFYNNLFRQFWYPFMAQEARSQQFFHQSLNENTKKNPFSKSCSIC